MVGEAGFSGDLGVQDNLIPEPEIRHRRRVLKILRASDPTN